MLYNYPGRTGVWMGETFLDGIAGNSNFKCIKEASGDIDRVHLLALQYPDLELSCGAEDQALEFFVWGATSWVTPMGNFIAEEVVAFYDTCVRDGDFAKARRMMAALMPLTTALERGGQVPAMHQVRLCVQRIAGGAGAQAHAAHERCAGGGNDRRPADREGDASGNSGRPGASAARGSGLAEPIQDRPVLLAAQ